MKSVKVIVRRMNSFGEIKQNVRFLVTVNAIKKGNNVMPAFKQSKYTKEKSAEIRLTALGVLVDAGRPLTISEICASDLSLTYQTTQKMARELSELVEAGLVMKTKSKSKGRMVYAAVASLESQGYDIENIIC